MHKTNEYKEGDSRKTILESLTKRDRIVLDTKEKIIINRLSFHFDKNDLLIKVTKICPQCKDIFTLKYLENIYGWCGSCNAINSKKYSNSKDFKKSTPVVTSCFTCKKKFKSRGLRICPSCHAEMDKTCNKTRIYKTELNHNYEDLVEVSFGN